MHFLQTHFLAKVRPQEMKIEYFSCPHPSLRPGIDITTCSRYVMTNLQNVHIFANAFFSRQSAFRRSQIFFEKDFFLNITNFLVKLQQFKTVTYWKIRHSKTVLYWKIRYNFLL